MPIYEYRCTVCGFQKEYLQKVSDPKLTVCPECGKDTFSKMLTAAGFQLKGSGWYATDFKNSGKPKDSGKPAADKSAANSSGNSGDSGKTDTAADTKTEPKAETKTETKTESKTEAKPAASGGTGTTPAAG